MCKDYYIIINGEKITVTEEVYYAYLRPVWKEHKREKIRQNCENSLDELIENGIDISDNAQPLCDIVGDKLILDMLIKAISELEEDEQYLLKELFFNEKSERDLSKESGLPQKTINNRKHAILKKLKNIF